VVTGHVNKVKLRRTQGIDDQFDHLRWVYTVTYRPTYFSGHSAWPSLRGWFRPSLGKKREFCVAVGSATSTAGILAEVGLRRGC